MTIGELIHASILLCDDLEGDCCPTCHEDQAEGEDDLQEIDDGAGRVLARTCCAKIEAARARLGLPKPERVTTAKTFR